MQEPNRIAKDVPAVEKSSEYLRIYAMQILAPKFNCMSAMNNREVVTNIGSPEEFVRIGFHEERLAKPE